MSNDSSRDITPIEKSAVTGQALERIKELILAGRFPPGSKLPPERELSAVLGISRSSVREAIRALSHMNIVEARHGQGTFVTSLSPQLLIEPLRFVMAADDDVIYELFELRKIVETGAARLAARRITGTQIAELQRHYGQLVASVHDAEAFLEHDVAMHELIARAAGNNLLLSLLASVSTLLRESRNRTGAIRAIRAQTVIDHGEIVEAIQNHDPERSAAAMMAHLDHVESRLRDLRHRAAAGRVQATETYQRDDGGNALEEEA